MKKYILLFIIISGLILLSCQGTRTDRNYVQKNVVKKSLFDKTLQFQDIEVVEFELSAISEDFAKSFINLEGYKNFETLPKISLILY